MHSTCHLNGYASEGYTLPALGYDASALENFLDRETVHLHHQKHHAAYVHGANLATAQLREIADGSLPLVMARIVTQHLTFHVAGHILHSIYWKSISPMPHNTPEGTLAEAIARTFGSYEHFLRLFTQLASSVQGSGWVVLGVEGLSQQLSLATLHQHQQELPPCFIPLIACDLWEHAYYLRYHNDRERYIAAFVAQLDWTYAQQQYTACHAQH